MSTTHVAAIYEREHGAVAATLTPDDLVHLYGRTGTQERAASAMIDDLTKVRFYDDFAAKPAHRNQIYDAMRAAYVQEHGQERLAQIYAANKHHPMRRARRYDFSLTGQEEQRLARHGFVATSRLCMESFGEAYYRLYTDDMPVYITADSILHAWHRSFDQMLMEIEEKYLISLLATILEESLDTIHRLHRDKATSMYLKRVLTELDVFLTVPLRLLDRQVDQNSEDTNNDHHHHKSSMWTWMKRVTKRDRKDLTSLDENAVKALIDLVHAEACTDVVLCAQQRSIDFSLFKPRGHYTKSVTLTKYFRAMSWLGIVDLNLVCKPTYTSVDAESADLFVLQCAVGMVLVLREAGQMDNVMRLERIISSLVGGGCDSMTPHALDKILTESWKSGPLATTLLCDLDVSRVHLKSLFQLIDCSSVAQRQILGRPAMADPQGRRPDLHPETNMARSFAFCGQQFTLSAFILEQLVFPNLGSVPRRIPSVSLDVGFALLGNDATVPELTRRMGINRTTLRGPERFRDGLPYTRNLIAARRTVDELYATAAKHDERQSIGDQWVGLLRLLSAKSPADAPVFHTDTWGLRMLTTQIASFTQLRHDTILYAKQSYACVSMCEYAAGYVDPYPEFWHAFLRMVDTLRSVLTSFDIAQTRLMWTLDSFVSTLTSLYEISVLQAKREPLTEQLDGFLKRVMEERRGSGGSRYLGWYPGLFYPERDDAGKKDVLVADVHTDPPSPEDRDPGGVVHLGVGLVNMGYFVVDNVMYAGPVMSSYELTTDAGQRLTDEAFAVSIHRYSCEKWASDSYLC